MQKYTIAVDAMGGDNAPNAIVAGCIEALREMDNIEILLCGPEETIRPLLADAADVTGRITVVHAPDVISMHEAPMMAVRKKTDSSMVRAMLEVKNGNAQAFVSAGSTGAVLAGGMIRIGRIRGVERPALAPVIPGKNHPFLLIDSGANVDCQAEYLVQFGMMGSIYMEKVMGVKNPKVGLVNIGTEEEKGNQMSKKAFGLMKEQKVFNFVGNVEAREVPMGDVDVIACDGFDGNIILKYTEGLASALTGVLKEELLGGGIKEKIGALLIKPALKRFKGRLDSEEHGGAPLLGVNAPMIKAHGSSEARGIKNALRQARTMIEGDVTGKIRDAVEKLMPEEEK
ncbi:MAG: phosphate acyltransferase PlsX [Clostridiales bacterium]|nr:phosphate acyltransferase PlsX [Clostridiales bacterium]